MNLNEEVGVLKVCTPDKKVLLVQPKPVEGNLIMPPFYGYLLGSTEEKGEQSAAVQTLEVNPFMGASTLVVATTVIKRVERLLQLQSYPIDPLDMIHFVSKVNDLDNPEMGVHVIPKIRLEVAKVNSDLFEKFLINARRRA
jgi:hypothetical protein